MSKREQFLLWMLSGLMLWQAAIFSYGVHVCAQLSHETHHPVCPRLGDRFEGYVQTSLGAILGLLAGSSLSKPVRKRGESDPP